MVNQPIGFPVYLPLDELQKQFGARLGMPPDAVTGALLSVDSRYFASIRQRLNRTEGVGLVQTKRELQAQIEQLLAFSRTFASLIFIFGMGMALTVTYTTTDIILWERTRELATLRTLGFSIRRLALLVTMENFGIALIGALMGLMPGRAVATFLLQASSTKSFSLSTMTHPRTYWQAVVGTLLVVLFAQWPGLRRVRRLDLASAIRLREG